MNIKPLFDRVVIKNVETEEVTRGGIVLPGSAKEKPQMAEVLAVGPGGMVDGKEVTMAVKVGQKVIMLLCRRNPGRSSAILWSDSGAMRSGIPSSTGISSIPSLPGPLWSSRC